MAKLLDQVLVIDVESTCWNRPPPPNQISEIIEIGLCTVDMATLRRREKRCILVSPARSHVSQFCTSLTGITPDLVEHADDLATAVDLLMNKYKSRERLFASWGDYDRGQFERNCRDYMLPYPFGPTHLNVKTLFSLALGLPEELEIDAACDRVGLPMEGDHHRGVDDAWNIANLFLLLLKRMRRIV
ncbi:3'-5' exonuclease [Lignipirellula cremea]|uniref:Sporulation inhibitor KapD n=1 Tax=Lignipirellula cremea TaxID=2528010 RepID=A0A518DUY3_9BACT|nr:3'-5' exonuclease [Lignipirellula cremea]QDU95650.1 sporulation inhibitor KapD [Lignipirellula cremea]